MIQKRLETKWMYSAGRIATSSLILLILAATTHADPPPNILFILVDDLGKEWISCYGSESVETPHIDALAASGM